MLEGLTPAWVSREDPHNTTAHINVVQGVVAPTHHKSYTGRNQIWTSRTRIYSSSPPFLERLLLRDLRRLGAAFLLRLRDLRRFADFLLGAAFLRDARRRLFGAMVNCNLPLLCGRHNQHQRPITILKLTPLNSHMTMKLPSMNTIK